MHQKPETNLTRACRYQQGLTIVELMVAIALGIFLSWGAVQAFLGGKQAYSLQKVTSRIQENGRMAQEFIGMDVRNSGDYGCGAGDGFITNGNADNLDAACTGINRVNVLDASSVADIRYDFNLAVYGYDGTETAKIAELNKFLNPDVVAQTDVLVTHPVEDVGVLTTGATAAAASLKISPAPDADSFIAVSDCANARIMKVVTVTPPDSAEVATTIAAGKVAGSTVAVSQGTALGENRCDIGMAVEEGASVREVDTVIYYIGQGANGNGLYRYSLKEGTSDPLLEGVENLQLRFGIDTNGDSKIDNAYRTADQVDPKHWNGWDQGKAGANELVRSVSYTLLMNGGESVLSEPQLLTFNGMDYVGGIIKGGSGTPDLFLRQVFAGVVGVRTRVNPG